MPKTNRAIESLKAVAGENKRKRLELALEEMKVKLKEIDALRRGLEREEFSGISPRKSREMLEEIKVPSLESIRHKA
ncbi:MAG TPA: hypothetical protein VFF09_02890 [archaeon]|nr:hypothetical protein [archaeon]